MRVLRSKKWLILTAVGVAASVGGGVALATVTSTVLSDTHPAGGSANEVRMRIVRSDFVPSADQPTFSSGWHTHPGPVIFQVQEGRVKITQGPPCRTTKLGPGETYVEIPEHPVVATANRAAKWTTTFILPADKPLLTPTDDPCRADHHDD
jgi:quercetin dioxygenase-like cupin family protein